MQYSTVRYKIYPENLAFIQKSLKIIRFDFVIGDKNEKNRILFAVFASVFSVRGKPLLLFER